MKILQLTVHFYPNVGGVETHLSDLVAGLVKKKNEVTVLAYQPLTAKANWRMHETAANLNIYRIPWIPGLFYKLVEKPILEFLYLLPGLFLGTPFILLAKKPEVIHAHGLVAGFIAVLWGKIFSIRVVVSVHSIYNFPKSGYYKALATWIFKNSQGTLCLSKQAAEEIKTLGVDEKKVKVFTYWINLKRFNQQKHKIKEKTKENNLIVLFVGRLVAAKGVRELLKAASHWNEKIDLIIVGTGPLQELVEKYSRKYKNIEFFKGLEQKDLPMYYNAADITIVPSTHEEGFGRVILESLACGTPVVAANRGAIPEAMDETVGRFIKVSDKNIREIVEYFFKNKKKLLSLAQNTRLFAERRYSEKNITTIIKSYQS